MGEERLSRVLEGVAASQKKSNWLVAKPQIQGFCKEEVSHASVSLFGAPHPCKRQRVRSCQLFGR